MKNSLLFLLFVLCVSNIYSQESTNLLYQFYGHKENPTKLNYIQSLSLGRVDDIKTEEINQYFDLNRDEICWAIDMKSFEKFLIKLGEKFKANNERANALVGQLANIAAQTITEIQQQKAVEKQEEAIRKEQQRAEFAARQAENKQKYAEFQAMTNKKVHSSDYQSNTSSYAARGSYNDLLTSDPNWNTQVQMWVQQYGVDKTREIVKQQRASNYQQSVQSSRSNSYNQSMSGKIISAVTSSRQQLKIKVNGNSVVAYSNGLDQVGRQNWISVVPGAGISKTGAGSLYSTGNLSKEFSCTANVNGMQIYFDM